MTDQPRGSAAGFVSRVVDMGRDKSGRRYRGECSCGWTSTHRMTEDEADRSRAAHERGQHGELLGPLAVACPLCGALSGQGCTASTHPGKGQHVRSHAERKRAYSEASR